MDADQIFAGAIAQLYDSCLVPTMFRPFALLIAERLAASDVDILETAAGTGEVTRHLAARAGPVRIVATDLNQDMLDIAQAKSAGSPITWRRADARKLLLDPASFDAAICSFGMMFIPEKVEAYRQVRRVLRPGGRFIFTVWARIDRNPLMNIVNDAVAKLFPEDPPSFLARTPCGYHDRDLIEQHAREAGFAHLHIEQADCEAIVPSADMIARGICQGSPLRAEIETRDPAGLDAATRAAEEALRSRFGDGLFRTPQAALLVTAS